MSQLFPKFTNLFAKLSIVAVLLGVGSLGFLGWLIARSPFATDVGTDKPQPIPFSHKIHVGDLKMDCRFCHTSVEKSSFAGIPPTETCLKCHSVVKTDSPLIAPLKQSKEANMPIEWVRVHDLPDHVYFDHSIHINKGIGCTTCHGQIDEMAQVTKVNSFQMGWCLSCHKHPDVNVRESKEAVFNMSWKPQSNKDVKTLHDHLNQVSSGRPEDLMSNAEKFQVRNPVNCSACHR